MHLRLDLFLHLEHADLLLDVHEHAAKALLDAQRLEQPLLLGRLELDVAGDEIGEPAWVGHCVEDLVDDFFGQAATLSEFGSSLTQFLMEGDERRVILVHRLHLLHGHHDGAEITLRRAELERRRALLALQQELDSTQPALNLPNARNNAHRVQNVRSRFIGVVALCNGEDQPLSFERGFDGAKSARTTGGDGRRQAGKYHCSSKGKNRQSLALGHDQADLREMRMRLVRRTVHSTDHSVSITAAAGELTFNGSEQREETRSIRYVVRPLPTCTIDAGRTASRWQHFVRFARDLRWSDLPLRPNVLSRSLHGC